MKIEQNETLPYYIEQHIIFQSRRIVQRKIFKGTVKRDGENGAIINGDARGLIESWSKEENTTNNSA